MNSTPDATPDHKVDDPAIETSHDLKETYPEERVELEAPSDSQVDDPLGTPNNAETSSEAPAELQPNPTEDSVATKQASVSAKNDRSLTTVHSRWERASKNRLAQIQSFSRKKKTICTIGTFMAMIAVIAIPSDSISSLLLKGLLLVLIAFIIALLAAKRLSFPPDRMHFTDRGLWLEWEPGMQSGATPVIPWHRVLYVGISKCQGCLFRDTWLDIHIQTTDMPDEDKKTLSWFFRDFSLYEEKCRLYVDLEGIAFSDDARKLLRAFALNVPQERIDPQLIDFLNPPKQESYTELWLSALSSPSDRLRNDPLPSGTNLQHGQYIVIDQIGAGGQGIAYRARVNSDPDLGTIAVLKEFILPSHGGNSVRKRSLEDVEREAELLKQIANPHIVALKEFFVEDERAYLVLEHINGQSLRSLIQEKGPLDSASFREISMQLCDILAHLHGQSVPVIHRDFTPENIMIGANNFTTLIDFNVAKQLQSTATKTVVGKHSYIPPEQFRGKATPQSDIYALGATMYFMLTGEDPEPISSSHPQEQNKNVSPALDALVARATAIDTQNRYPDITTLKSDLQELSSAAAARSPAS
jgi:hypothetical protein